MTNEQYSSFSPGSSTVGCSASSEDCSYHYYVAIDSAEVIPVHIESKLEYVK